MFFLMHTFFGSIFVAHGAFHHVFAIYRFIRSERDALNALRVHIHLIRATVMVFKSSLCWCILHTSIRLLCTPLLKRPSEYQEETKLVFSQYMPTSYQFHFTLIICAGSSLHSERFNLSKGDALVIVKMNVLTDTDANSMQPEICAFMNEFSSKT